MSSLRAGPPGTGQPPRIICLGLSALDVVWQVERLFAGGSEKVRASGHASGGGGMAATAAVAVARLGGRAAFWGRAGQDGAGEEMRRGLASEGVDTTCFRLFQDGRSSVSGIIVDGSGERQIANFRGAFPSDADWLPLSEVAEASAVLADPRWPEGAAALFRSAREAGVPSILDGDVATADVFEQLLPLTDHAVFSEPGLAGFAGPDSEAALARVAEFGCRVAAVTQGADGVLWREGGGTFRQPAYPVAAIDTTGAGDVFHGAYALAIGSGSEVADAVSFASAAAALKCTRPGGRGGIPSLNECLVFQRTHA